MKKTLVVLAAVLVALVATSPRPAVADKWFGEPCLKSQLCNGLIEHWSLDEGSDSNRYGAFTSQLREPNAANVANDTTNKVTGTAALSLSGSNYLWTNRAGWPITVAFWMRPTSVPANGVSNMLIDRTSTNKLGPQIYITTSGGVTNVTMCVTSRDNHSSICSPNTQAISVNTWYYVVAGFGTIRNVDGVAIGSGIFTSVTPKTATSPNAKQWSSSIGFDVEPGTSQLRVGANFASDSADSAGVNLFTGQVDSLDFAGREWQDVDISKAFNGNAGRAYPYVTE